jgi:5'-deoxynucleotidase YfbR-like HD superfamily hydrolase
MSSKFTRGASASKAAVLRDTPQPPPRAWQRMLSGRRLDLLDPSPLDIEIEDIAHGLSRVARWNGQTLGEHALSVAQHVLIVEEIACDRNPDWPPAWRLATLLHDAQEYVVGDLISPFKTAIGLDYKAFEKRLNEAIHVRFGLPPVLPADIVTEIKAADSIAAYFEATVLAGFERDEALRFFGKPAGISTALSSRLEQLAPLPTAAAQNLFLKRFAQLSQSPLSS